MESFEPSLDELSARVHRHPLEGRLVLEQEAWVAWRTMSLLKSIQAEVAPCTVPWRPPADLVAARLVNDLVATEETERFPAHLAAMREAGASTAAVERFLAALPLRGVDEALIWAKASAPAQTYVRATLALLAEPLPCRVAAFSLGRGRPEPRELALYKHLCLKDAATRAASLSAARRALADRLALQQSAR
jgi:hypothetical protein